MQTKRDQIEEAVVQNMNREERARKAIDLVMQATAHKKLTEERLEGIPSWDS